MATFFVDRSLGRRFAASLREAGYDVRWHDDRFAQDTPDVEWLAEVGRQGWIVLTHDDHIYRNSVEREAAAEAGVALFILTGGSVPMPEITAAFLRTAPRVLAFAETHARPFVASVGRSSTAGQPGPVTLRHHRPRRSPGS